MNQQQTVLRVQTNIPHPTITGATEYMNLDLYSDIPIKINKSFSELQDIAKKNSDYSIGLSLPGSKKNNIFFESFFNVDSQSLYFNASKRVKSEVILMGEVYFRGYLKLNKVSVQNSMIEYDVTLYSEVGDLFGKIGNNLLRDLDFDDTEYTFNHTFSVAAVGDLFAQSNFFKDSEYPYTYFYPIVHNGYNYIDVSGDTIVNFTGSTVSQRTRLYTPTTPIGFFTGNTAAYTAGVQEYRINSPNQGIYDNQLKPALNIYSLIKLMFKSYGYNIESDFFNTPWFKSLYLYGYYSANTTKFGYKLENIEVLPPEGVELIFKTGATSNVVNTIVCKLGTGIPCFCLSDITFDTYFNTGIGLGSTTNTIQSLTSGYTQTAFTGWTFSFGDGLGVAVADASTLKYMPVPIGSSIAYFDGDTVDFNLVIDENIKQIDLLSSIAKKFDLIFISEFDNPNVIKIEPYDFYVGTGTVYDWTPKLSWDKGFTVEPALNYIESTLELTDQEDGDEGNREFKINNNRIYGRNIVYNPTDFKSQDKKIDTIFSPELIRQWDTLGVSGSAIIGLPLGINYAASSEINDTDNKIEWFYNGVKSKPKLMFWGMGLNPFTDEVGEVFDAGLSGINTYTIKLQNSTGGTATNYDRIPSISHTIPMGLSDQFKINNDSLCILFNSEQQVQTSVPLYNTYTENDVYNIFYNNRITNLYDQNTRFISGYFDLNYPEIQNLKWNDIIKINEQYFIINKISEFNLVERELTKVELIQFNVNPQEYPTRYFKYQYCDQTGYCFSMKTDFTNPNLQDTNFIWSIYYDNQVGSLTGQTSGFTSTFRFFNTGSFRNEYVPYSMNEITESEYYSSSCVDTTCDTLLNNFRADQSRYVGSLISFWENSGYTKTGVNVWNNCSDFNTTRSTYGIITGSSTTYGTNACLSTPTPTPTGTPTPTPTGPTNTPTPTPTNTPTPTPTPSPTPGGPTPTPTPTSTPVPVTGYTAGFYILVNDSLSSYPGTGTTWISLVTGTTYNGTLTNGPVWTSGTPGYFTFDGTNDWVDFGSSSLGPANASFTFGGWVKSTTSSTQKVFMMRGNDASTNGWSLFVTKESDNKFQAGVVTQIPTLAQTNAKSITSLVDNTWYYLVGVWDAGTSIKIYVNGILETTTLTTRTNLRSSGIGWNLMRGNGPFYSNGDLSEFIVYQSVLSDAAILNNFNINKSKYGY